MSTQQIPIVNLEADQSNLSTSRSILKNEINGVQVHHHKISSKESIEDITIEDSRTIYLFVKGKGTVTAQDTNYEIVPETILLPNAVEKIAIRADENNTLHYLKISCKLSEDDLVNLKELPQEHTQNIYYTKFDDCQSYTEEIKSPNTTSRTILPNSYIPRVAMGTVKTIGPDEVGAHEHPMLEQLFLGLSKNKCIVYADEANVDFPEYSVLHIPLGSRHSVTVDKDEIMYYVWMDFFLDKKGEEWLKTHKLDEE